jgi:hypothetical protein
LLSQDFETLSKNHEISENSNFQLRQKIESLTGELNAKALDVQKKETLIEDLTLKLEGMNG